MVEQDYRKSLFQNEVKVIENSQNIIKNYSFNDSDLIEQYRNLVRDYEKLLKNTIKTYKISDIQGKMLKEQEAEITRMNDDLRKVEDSRKRFISDISHEMGAPIRAILSFLKIVVDGKAQLNDKYIQLIYERISVVNELIQDLFDLSVLEANGTTFHFKEIPINGLLKTICSKYEIDVKAKGIHFVYEDVSGHSELFVSLDLFRIGQVMANLINNAIKFTPPGGTISIKAELSCDQSKFSIIVSDDGIGIDEKKLPFIFERFYKGDQQDNESGTGLGLSIAKEIIMKHNGSISVLSEKNEGTSFIISLPVYQRSQ